MRTVILHIRNCSLDFLKTIFDENIVEKIYQYGRKNEWFNPQEEFQILFKTDGFYSHLAYEHVLPRGEIGYFEFFDRNKWVKIADLSKKLAELTAALKGKIEWAFEDCWAETTYYPCGCVKAIIWEHGDYYESHRPKLHRERRVTLYSRKKHCRTCDSKYRSAQFEPLLYTCNSVECTRELKQQLEEQAQMKTMLEMLEEIKKRNEL